MAAASTVSDAADKRVQALAHKKLKATGLMTGVAIAIHKCVPVAAGCMLLSLALSPTVAPSPVSALPSYPHATRAVHFTCAGPGNAPVNVCVLVNSFPEGLATYVATVAEPVRVCSTHRIL